MIKTRDLLQIILSDDHLLSLSFGGAFEMRQEPSKKGDDTSKPGGQRYDIK